MSGLEALWKCKEVTSATSTLSTRVVPGWDSPLFGCRCGTARAV